MRRETTAILMLVSFALLMVAITDNPLGRKLLGSPRVKSRQQFSIVNNADEICQSTTDWCYTSEQLNGSQDNFAASNYSIENPKHWVPDWALNEDLDTLLHQRKILVEQRCKDLPANSYRWSRPARAAHVKTKTVDICLTAKGGSSFWRRFRKLQILHDGEITDNNKRIMFVVARNPWHRLVSAWNAKFRDNNAQRKLYMRSFCRGKTWREMPPFSVFIEECVLKLWRNGRRYNEHWQPVIDRCHVCRSTSQRFHFYIAAENMNPESSYILENYAGIPGATERITVSLNSSLRCPNVNKTDGYQEHYRDVSAENIAVLREIYQYEIYVFGYPDTPFVDFERS